MSFSTAQLLVSLEIVLAIAGAVLLWRLVLSPAARARPSPPALPRWEVSVAEFLVFLLFVIGGSFVAAVVAGVVGKQLPLRGDEVTVFHGAVAQLGMLAGVWLYWSRPERDPPRFLPIRRNIFLAGAATFLLSLPILILIAALWAGLLQAVGLPTDRQSLIGMFANAESPWMLGIMFTLAVVIAPLTEELIFRAGLFRYFRTRLPRWLALVGPALFFASLHVNWATLEGLASLAPLVALAVIFSLAYERTGQIGTAIVAHALFNFHTVLLILSGVEM
jgi:uncharacterized protein